MMLLLSVSLDDTSNALLYHSTFFFHYHHPSFEIRSHAFTIPPIECLLLCVYWCAILQIGSLRAPFLMYKFASNSGFIFF